METRARYALIGLFMLAVILASFGFVYWLENKGGFAQRKTYQVQQEAQMQRQLLVRETSLADIQQEVVKSEQGVNIAELQAAALVKRASGDADATRLKAHGEAEAIRATGEARADAYKAGAEAMGAQGYTAVQLMQIVGERGVRIIPEILVGQSGNGSMVEALLGMVLKDQLGRSAPPAATTNGNGSAAPVPPVLPEQKGN